MMSMSRTAIRRASLAGGVLAAVAVMFWLLLGGRGHVKTDNAYVKADKVSVASEVTGLVRRVAVRPNQLVHQGDLLVQLDDQPYRLAVAESEAGLAQVRNEILARRADHAETLAQLQQAYGDADYFERQLDRSRRLDDVAVSAAQLDEARQALARARAQIEVYSSRLASLEADLGGGPEVPVEAQPDYQAALARLEKARYQLARTTLLAPADGMVANEVPLEGEVAAAGIPLVTVLRTDSVWVEANLKETELSRVRAGQHVEIHVDAYPGETWQATVDSMSPASGAEFALIPPQNASGNWVKVVQRIPVRLRLLQRPGAPVLRAGMSAEVDIDTGSGRVQTAGVEG